CRHPGHRAHRRAWSDLPDGCGAARRRLHRARRREPARPPQALVPNPVRLLDRVSWIIVCRHGGRSHDREGIVRWAMDRDEARKNVRLGMLLFFTALIMFGLAFAWALIYNNF